MTKEQINSKSIARIAAIQTLYKFENSKEELDINSTLLRIIDFYKDANVKSDHDIEEKSKIKLKPSYNYLKELVYFTSNNIIEIDNIIEKYLTKDWTLSNLPILLHSLLRVAIAEMIFFSKTPKKVIINEYTDIASDMLNENEIGFVNSLLDNYAEKRK